MVANSETDDVDDHCRYVLCEITFHQHLTGRAEDQLTHPPQGVYTHTHPDWQLCPVTFGTTKTRPVDGASVLMPLQ